MAGLLALVAGAALAGDVSSSVSSMDVPARLWAVVEPAVVVTSGAGAVGHGLMEWDYTPEHSALTLKAAGYPPAE